VILAFRLEKKMKGGKNMKEQNAWVAVAVVVIVAIVAGYFGMMAGGSPAYAPESSDSSGGITVTGVVVYTSGTSGSEVDVGLDLNGDGKSDVSVRLSKSLASQFGYYNQKGEWVKKLVGVTIEFGECKYDDNINWYVCESKHIGSNLAVTDSTEFTGE